MSDGLAAAFRSPPDYQVWVPLHDSFINEPPVRFGQVHVLSAGGLGDSPNPLQEELLVVPQEPLRAEVLANLLRVLLPVLPSDSGEDCLCQAPDHALRCVPQVVRHLEADPLARPGPLKFEVPEGGELRFHVIKSVSCSGCCHRPCQHLVAAFHFLLSPGSKCPEKGLADVRLRDWRAPRTHSRKEGADGPICARSVPAQGTRHGREELTNRLSSQDTRNAPSQP